MHPQGFDLLWRVRRDGEDAVLVGGVRQEILVKTTRVETF